MKATKLARALSRLTRHQRKVGRWMHWMTMQERRLRHELERIEQVLRS